jgi:hypothetical protein
LIEDFYIDKIGKELFIKTFGGEKALKRQEKILRHAKVIQY